jgi:N-acetylglucosamine-6-phosphate deacetylase
VTLAPEIAGIEAIRRLTGSGVIVAAGHTEATYDQLCEAFSAGVTGVTHLFNAMPPMQNRTPGAVGAALDNQQAWCGIIVDGVHVHPAILRVALRSRPNERFMLVTDAMPPIGTSATSFSLQGRLISVTDRGCVDELGTLAGSNLTMDAAVRNLIRLVGVPTTTSLRLASNSPAQFLGMADCRGEIAPGKIADIVWLDDDMSVRSTWIGGEELGR